MSRKNKRYSDSRLREIALMASKGLPAELIAEIKGLPPKSVANICWIYKWSPEKLDEMTERGKLRGPKGDDARTCLRRYFVMHPEQRPAPHLKLFREGPKEAVEGCHPDSPETMHDADRDFVSDLHRTLLEAGDAGKTPDLQTWSLSRRVVRLEDLATIFRDDLDQLKIARENHDERLSNNHKRIVAFQRFIDDHSVLPAAQLTSREGHVVDNNARQRLDLLWKFSAAQNERLIEVEHRLEEPDKLADQLTSLAGRVDELERRVAVMHRDVAGLKQASGPEALPVTLDRLAMCERRIARLQEILKAVFRVLPAEYA